MTHPQTLAALLNYFRSGDTPTQDQFEELIRTMFDLMDAAQADADAAVASVEALVATSARAVGRLQYDKTTDTWTELFLEGATVAYSGTGNRTVTITFTAAFSDANVYFEDHNSDGNAIDPITPTKAAATLEYVIGDDSGYLNFVVYGTPPA